MKKRTKKTVLIHGAINTSNFGDVLFASLFYNRLSKDESRDVYFVEAPEYGVGEFVRNEIQYKKHISWKKMISADVLVYMSGGYFGDDKKSVRLSIRRFFRYTIIGLIFIIRNKTIVVSGVGGGPVFNRGLRSIFVNILNHSKIITMRDAESASYFKKNGVVKPILVTADTALSITQESLPEIANREVKCWFAENENRKSIFFHLSTDAETDELISEKVVPNVLKFLDRNKEYKLIIGMDGYYDYHGTKTYGILEKVDFFEYQYSSAWQLCSVLNKVDIVLTYKLHVGIVASALGKSIISYPIHKYKTQRFYQQIGESERCVPLKEIDGDSLYDMLELYKNKSISISKDIREKARYNLDILDNI